MQPPLRLASQRQSSVEPGRLAFAQRVPRAPAPEATDSRWDRANRRICPSALGASSRSRSASAVVGQYEHPNLSQTRLPRAFAGGAAHGAKAVPAPTTVRFAFNRSPGATPRGFAFLGQCSRGFARSPSTASSSTTIARDHERRRGRPVLARERSLRASPGREHQRAFNGSGDDGDGVQQRGHLPRGE